MAKLNSKSRRLQSPRGLLRVARLQANLDLPANWAPPGNRDCPFLRAGFSTRRQRSRRCGVLLLVVLSLLVLFSLMALTYAIVAGNFRRGVQQAHKLEQRADNPRDTLDEALRRLSTGR